MPLILADAVVKLSLDTSEYQAQIAALNSNFKKQTQGLNQGLTEGIKQQNKATDSMLKANIAEMRKTARALGTVGRELTKAGNLIFKFGVLPAIGLGTAGIHKYLQTTDAGAKQLSKSLTVLKNSWDQLLARTGKAIYDHTILGKVIKSLSSIMDKITEKDILRYFDTAKIALFTAAIFKLAGTVTTTLAQVIKLRAAFATLSLSSVSIRGNLLSGIMGREVKSTGGLVGGLGIQTAVSSIMSGKTANMSINKAVNNIMAGPEATAAINGLVLASKEGTIAANIQKAAALTQLAASKNKFGFGGGGLGGLPGRLGGLSFVSLAKNLGLAGVILIGVIGTFTMIMSLLKGLGIDSEKIKAYFSDVTSVLGNVFKFLKTLFESIIGLFADLGTGMSRGLRLMFGFFETKKGVFKEIASEKGFFNKFYKQTAQPWKDWNKNSGSDENESFGFKAKLSSPMGFADLNKYQQDLSQQTPTLVNSLDKLTNAVDRNTDSKYADKSVGSPNNWKLFSPAYAPNF